MSPRPLVLLGAGGLAAEVIEAVRAAGHHEPVAVLDDSCVVGQLICGVPVVGGTAECVDVAGRLGAEVVLCLGRGTTRRALRARLGTADVEWATIIHPSVAVPSSCRVGVGTVVLANVTLTARVRIDSHVVVMPGAVVTHDDVVEDYATLCAGVMLGGGVQVRSAAYIGMGASVRQHVVVGADSLLGMGAVLLRDLPAGEVWGGVPARPLGLVETEP